jgi:hypothetical protein
MTGADLLNWSVALIVGGFFAFLTWLMIDD